MRWPQNRRLIGTKVPRLDAPEKATGRAKYSFDINQVNGERVLHARMLRCPYAHARVRSIDMSAAEKMPGVRATPAIVKPDAQLYFPGAEIAAIAADTEEHAEDAIRAIRIDYEQLPHLVKEEDALRATTNTVAGTNIQGGGEFETANFDKVAYQGVDATIEGR